MLNVMKIGHDPQTNPDTICFVSEGTQGTVVLTLDRRGRASFTTS